GRANRVIPGAAGVNLPPPPEFGDFFQSFPRLVETMHLQAQTMANMHAREGNAGVANQQGEAEPVRANGATMMEHFRRMGPPTFKGESSPDVVEYWICETEKIFRAIRCPEEDKVNLATFTLQGKAYVWWTFALRTIFENMMNIAWDEFLVAFREKYFPK